MDTLRDFSLWYAYGKHPPFGFSPSHAICMSLSRLVHVPSTCAFIFISASHKSQVTVVHCSCWISCIMHPTSSYLRVARSLYTPQFLLRPSSPPFLTDYILTFTPSGRIAIICPCHGRFSFIFPAAASPRPHFLAGIGIVIVTRNLLSFRKVNKCNCCLFRARSPRIIGCCSTSRRPVNRAIRPRPLG